MTQTHPITHLSTTQLRIGYQHKGRAICIAKTPELDIRAGDFICLLGANGVGKSTLIRTLSGIQTPLQGTLRLGNQPAEQLSPRERAKKISVVLTEIPSLGMMNADSLVALGRHPHTGNLGTLKPNDLERIDWAFQTMDAMALKKSTVAQLSDGERQKLLIARALAQDTPLMLLDEPTAFLDLPRRVELMVTLRKLAHEKTMGILLSTHDLDLALRFADCIWLLDEVGNLCKGYPEALALNGAIRRAFSSRHAEWQSEQGTFGLNTHSTLKASVRGDDVSTLWTRRALERLGFCIVEDAQADILQVSVRTMDNQTKWQVDGNGLKHTFDTISDCIKCMSHLKLVYIQTKQ